MDNQKTDAANERWRQHSEDEAAHREAQQDSAGGTHRPVQGPPPYGNEQVNLMAAAIVQAERERCARLVEGWPVGTDAGSAELLREVAARIRREP